jgi:hypothetical protein
MAKTPTYTTTYPTTGAGFSGTNYANVTIAGNNGASLTYATGTGVAAQWSTTATTPWYTQQSKVKISEEDIEIDGLSLRDFMASVNERMAIMVPNPKLEKEFEELRELADRYRELERKLLEQKAMWATLKRTDNK